MGTHYAPRQKRGTAPPQFSAHVCCGQTAEWIKMPLGAEVGLSIGDIVLDRNQLPSPKGTRPQPIFGPCMLWPNGWMDEDATWYESRPRPRPHCVRRGPSSPRERSTTVPVFSAHVYWGHGRPSQLLWALVTINICCSIRKFNFKGPSLPVRICLILKWVICTFLYFGCLSCRKYHCQIVQTLSLRDF